MKKFGQKGIGSLEALIALAFSIGLLGAFIGVESQWLENTRNASKEFGAIIDAEKCALLADAQYANSSINEGGFGLKSRVTVKCHALEEGKNFVSFSGGVRGEAPILNQRTSRNGNAVEVASEDHYLILRGLS